MAEEEKTQSVPGPASKPASGDAKEQKEDFKGKYEELQSKHQTTVEELRSTKGTLDALDQYGAINWDAITGEQKEAPQKSDGAVETSKVVETKLRQLEEKQENQLLALQFRQDYPDLREYETTLVGPALMRVRRLNPRASKQKLLDLAAEDVHTFLKKQEEKVIAKQKSTKAKEDAVKASGLESAGSTSPNEDNKGQTNDEYIAERRAALTKKKGL